MTTRARREREKEGRRRSILKAAREAFFEHGFQHVTVDDIAERAEVSKGTVYLYFESKEAILAHLLLDALDALLAELDAACAQPVAAADDQLRQLCATYLRFFEREPQVLHLLMAMDRGRFRDAVPAEMVEQVLEASLQGLDLAVRAVQQGIDAGLFCPCDSRRVAAVLWATLNGVLELVQHPLRREMVGVERELLYRAAIELFIRGLYRIGYVQGGAE